MLALSLLLLSYLMLAILAVAALAGFEVRRTFRGLILLPLIGFVFTLAALYGDLGAGGLSETLPGSGRPIAWAWFPLFAAMVLSVGGGPHSYVLIVCSGLSWLAMFAVESSATEVSSLSAALAAHHTCSLGLAAVALAAGSRIYDLGTSEARRRWHVLSATACGLLVFLVLSLMVIYAFQERPLHLPVPIAMLVLPAETIAAICVWRGVQTVAKTVADSADSDVAAGTKTASRSTAAGGLNARTATAVLALFLVAGISLAWIPVILNGASRFGE